MFGWSILRRVLNLGFGWLEKSLDINLAKYEIDSDLHKTALEASLELEKVRVAQAIADNSNWVTRWIRPAFAAVILVYMGAIVVDSIWIHQGFVQDVPDKVHDWFMLILTFYFGARPVEKIVDKWVQSRS